MSDSSKSQGDLNYYNSPNASLNNSSDYVRFDDKLRVQVNGQRREIYDCFVWARRRHLTFDSLESSSFAKIRDNSLDKE